LQDPRRGPAHPAGPHGRG